MTGTKNISASVLAKLKNYNKQQYEAFDLTLRRYANERFLYRLSLSSYADKFILKGAQLFVIWQGNVYRPTKDIDLLCLGDPSPENINSVIREIVAVDVNDDGLAYDADSVSISEIGDDVDYGGLRVKFIAHLGKAKIDLQIDFGFGDAITPKVVKADFPVILDQPLPRLSIYPVETVIAEKLEAIVKLGIVNSRMKDFYDLIVISERMPVDGSILAKAIRNTFERRATSIPVNEPVAFTPEFSENSQKQIQWQSFIRKNELEASNNLNRTIEKLKGFLIAPIQSARKGKDFSSKWNPGGPWTIHKGT